MVGKAHCFVLQLLPFSICHNTLYSSCCFSLYLVSLSDGNMSEVLCFTILTHMSDLDVKVTDLEKNYVKIFWLNFLEAKGNSGELLSILQQFLFIYFTVLLH